MSEIVELVARAIHESSGLMTPWDVLIASPPDSNNARYVEERRQWARAAILAMENAPMSWLWKFVRVFASSGWIFYPPIPTMWKAVMRIAYDDSEQNIATVKAWLREHPLHDDNLRGRRKLPSTDASTTPSQK